MPKKMNKGNHEVVSDDQLDTVEDDDERINVTEKKSKDKVKIKKKKKEKDVNFGLQELKEANVDDIEKKEKLGKKKKKKRDRRGQIINDTENGQESHEVTDNAQDTIVDDNDSRRIEVTEQQSKDKEKKSKDKAKILKKRKEKDVTVGLQEAEEVHVDDIEEKEVMVKKKKKKRDRWGQIINDTENAQRTHEDIDNTGDTIVDDKDPQRHADEYESKAISVGGMPYDTTEEDILNYFSECGEVGRIICMKFPDTQRFSGLAIITFKEASAASKALGFDGHHMGNRCIKVESALKEKVEKLIREPPKREGDSLSVYIGNLDWNVQKVDIKRFLKGCNIDNVRLAVDRKTGNFRGYGHVDFSDDLSLEKAIKMDQKELLGRPVKISYAVTKRD